MRFYRRVFPDLIGLHVLDLLLLCLMLVLLVIRFICPDVVVCFVIATQELDQSNSPCNPK